MGLKKSTKTVTSPMWRRLVEGKARLWKASLRDLLLAHRHVCQRIGGLTFNQFGDFPGLQEKRNKIEEAIICHANDDWRGWEEGK